MSGQWEEAIAVYKVSVVICQDLVAIHPANLPYKAGLAHVHATLGHLTVQMGKPADALASYQTARDIQQALVDGNPAVAKFQSDLAMSHSAIGRVLIGQKRYTDAFVALEAGLTIRRTLADANPKNAWYANQLGLGRTDRGWARVRAGQPAEGAADLRQAVELWAKYPPQDVETWLERGRALALLAGLSADAKSGVTVAESAFFADQAAATLANAPKGAWAKCDELNGPDFDALRNREDFQKMVRELEAKAPKVPAVAPPPRAK
jgi:tetratricopeptide (TPR) repeat protein